MTLNANFFAQCLRKLPEPDFEALCLDYQLGDPKLKKLKPEDLLARAILQSNRKLPLHHFSSEEHRLLELWLENHGVWDETLIGPWPDRFSFFLSYRMAFQTKETKETKAGSHSVYILPIAILLHLEQIRISELHTSFFSNTLRHLFCKMTEDAKKLIGAHFSEKHPVKPYELALEKAYAELSSHERLHLHFHTLSEKEKHLLEAIVQRGGSARERDLFALEGSSVTLQYTQGISLSKSKHGTLFDLQKKGFLFPVHPDRYFISSEFLSFYKQRNVSNNVKSHDTLRASLLAENAPHSPCDLEPRKAKFAPSPSAFFYASVLSFQHYLEEKEKTKSKEPVQYSFVSFPKSLLERTAKNIGREAHAIHLWAALFSEYSIKQGTLNLPKYAFFPPEGLRDWPKQEFGTLPHLLFKAWRESSLWNELLPHPSALRVDSGREEPGPILYLRRLIFSVLQSRLFVQKWFSFSLFYTHLKKEKDFEALESAHLRSSLYREETSETRIDFPTACYRILSESLFALGILDQAQNHETERTERVDKRENTLFRLSALGKRVLSPEHYKSPSPKDAVAGIGNRERTASESSLATQSFLENSMLCVGDNLPLSFLSSLSLCSELTSLSPVLRLDLTEESLRKGVSQGISLENLSLQFDMLKLQSEALSSTFERASRTYASLVSKEVAFFLFVHRNELSRLLEHPATKDLFVLPALQEGLLVKASVTKETLKEKLSLGGYMLDAEGTVFSCAAQNSK